MFCKNFLQGENEVLPWQGSSVGRGAGGTLRWGDETQIIKLLY